jgi:hypothetical protein
MQVGRIDILSAFRYFSPASVDVIARIEHMEQQPEVAMHCRQLWEDGLLEQVPSEHEIMEYQLSTMGRSMMDGPELHVPATKMLVYRQLRAKERIYVRMRTSVYQTLLHAGRFICLLELRTLLSDPLTVPELSSVLFGLLYTDRIAVCGPLYGVLRDHTLPS